MTRMPGFLNPCLHPVLQLRGLQCLWPSVVKTWQLSGTFSLTIAEFLFSGSREPSVLHQPQLSAFSPPLYFHYSCLCLPWLHSWLLWLSLTAIATVTAITAQEAAMASPLLVCGCGWGCCTKASWPEALPLCQLPLKQATLQLSQLCDASCPSALPLLYLSGSQLFWCFCSSECWLMLSLCYTTCCFFSSC